MLDENWFWKPEPVSPNGALSLFIDPNWLSINPNILENAVSADETLLYDENAACNEVFDKFVIDNNESVKEEPLQDWFEQKINFSTQQLSVNITENDNLKIDSCVNPTKVIPQRSIQSTPLLEVAQPIHLENIEESDIFQDFNDLLNAEKDNLQRQCHLDDTVPEISIQTINQDELYNIFLQNPFLINSNTSSLIDDQTSISTSSPDSSVISEEMMLTTWDNDQSYQLSESQDIKSDDEDEDEDKEETNKDKTEDINTNYVEINLKHDSIPSPCSESNTCESFAFSETSNSDPDWLINNKKKSARKYNRTHPYSRQPYVKVSPDERKVRKKEQNKNAATRYRQKKKQEIIEIVHEEQQLLDKNTILKEKATDLEREIKYLKNLLRDLYTVKGLIK